VFVDSGKQINMKKLKRIFLKFQGHILHFEITRVSLERLGKTKRAKFLVKNLVLGQIIREQILLKTLETKKMKITKCKIK
jgi:hypothetical protein